MSESRAEKEGRLFTRDGRRHYRRTYSATELRIGVVILVALLAIAAWVVHKGHNPDPALFAAAPGQAPRELIASDRGIVPEGLAGDGFSEGRVSQFGKDNLYEKINGREGYYKSFGFERLYFVPLTLDADPKVTVDLELYDLGAAPNALGAFGGERDPKVPTLPTKSGLAQLHRNSLFLTQGRFYGRAIGSEESAVITAQLRFLQAVLEKELPSEKLPGALGLFSKLRLDPAKVTFQPENAFSFGFAQRVWVATAPDDTELFVAVRDDAPSAAALSARFIEGFLGYGTSVEDREKRVWAQDRYLSRFSSAASSGRWVIGIRGAPTVADGAKLLEQLRATVQNEAPASIETTSAENAVEDAADAEPGYE